MLITFIIFFLILSSLILVHEAGHFFAAKRSGIKVHEFGLGLPPKIWGKKYGETEYTLNWLPIGGFVKIEGEDPSEPIKDKKHNFQTKSPLTKLFVLLAGIIMNVVLAIVLYYFYFLFNNFLSNPLILFTNYNFVGANTLQLQTTVSGFSDETPLKDQLVSGDVIVNVIDDGKSLNDNTVTNLSVLNKNEIAKEASNIQIQNFQQFIDESQGDIDLVVYNIQTNKVKEVVANPQFNDELQRKVLGLYLGSVVYLDYGSTTLSKVLSAPMHSINVIGYSMSSFSKLISLSFETKDIEVISSGVSGPVGIFSVVQAILSSNTIGVFWVLIDLTALISLSLAFMNILPIPALDGGRAVFVLFEGLTKKKVDPVVEGQIHKFGMIFLLLLLAIITLKDFINLF